MKRKIYGVALAALLALVAFGLTGCNLTTTPTVLEVTIGSTTIYNNGSYSDTITSVNSWSGVVTIKNTSTTDTINLTGTPPVVLSDNSKWSLDAQPSLTSLAPGASTTFTLNGTGLTTGSNSVTVTMSNDGPDTSPTFTFTVSITKNS